MSGHASPNFAPQTCQWRRNFLPPGNRGGKRILDRIAARCIAPLTSSPKVVPSVFIEGHCETIEIESQILFDLVDQTRAQLLAATMHRQLGAALAADNGEMATPALVTFERTALPSEPPAKLSRRDDATRMLCPGAPLPAGLMFTSLRTSLLYVADAGLEQRQTEGHGAFLLGAGLRDPAQDQACDDTRPGDSRCTMGSRQAHRSAQVI